ncbi:GGDEF domain-containing protein [Desulforegula conservatrix]|uniref:GGDEF domain-containing protein n=1 Tax=Desulforegula conservatrix TaxID=153026 RepID=UPI000426180D|nr:protoglobin domain-containing protein [Desulforegula conservatrix]
MKKNKIESNILEYLAITDTEILKRKQLLRFSLTDAQILGQFRKQFTEKTDQVAEEFIKAVKTIQAFSKFNTDSSLDHIIPSLKSYVEMFFGGVYSKEYVQNRLEIGLICRANGIEPKYFHAASKILKDIIFDTIKSTVNDRILDDFVVDAIDKLMAFDVSLAADAYINSPFIPRMDSPQPEPQQTKPDSKKQNKASATNPFASAFFKVAEQNKKLRTAMKKETVNNPFALAYFKVAARQHELMQFNDLRKKQMNPLALAYFKAVNQNRDLQAKLAKDTLTGLYSQDVFTDFLKRNISYSKRISFPIAMACMEIEDYNEFIEVEGITRADEAIAFIGAMLQEVIRDVDLASRSEGRFYVVFPGTSGQNALVCCKRIVDCFSSVYGRKLTMGIADTGPENFVTSEVFLEMALENMIKAGEEPKEFTDDDIYQEVEIT